MIIVSEILKGNYERQSTKGKVRSKTTAMAHKMILWTGKANEHVHKDTVRDIQDIKMNFLRLNTLIFIVLFMFIRVSFKA